MQGPAGTDADSAAWCAGTWAISTDPNSPLLKVSVSMIRRVSSLLWTATPGLWALSSRDGNDTCGPGVCDGQRTGQTGAFADAGPGYPADCVHKTPKNGG